MLVFVSLPDRIKVENATLLESIATMERLTSLVHGMHTVLMKVRQCSYCIVSSSSNMRYLIFVYLKTNLCQAYDDVKSDSSLESTYEALNSLITEANLMKTALGVVLPVSWSGEHDSSDSPKSSKSEKADPLSSAGMEMVELLILAADIVKESFMLKR